MAALRASIDKSIHRPDSGRAEMTSRAHSVLLALAAACAFIIQAFPLVDTVSAQVSCQQFGNQTFCNNGQSFQQFGNQTFDNRGNSWQQFGNQTFGSQGDSYQRFGNQTFDNHATRGSNLAIKHSGRMGQAASALGTK